MKRPLGCLSVHGLVVSALALMGVGGVVLVKGPMLFSPGPLTRASRGVGPLLGYVSHADFEDQCILCHHPWEGVSPAYCVGCHTAVGEQIAAGTGLHGYMQDAEACTYCHSEHRGRQANNFLVALTSFSHDTVGFSLERHQQLPDGRTFDCSNCHPPSDYAIQDVTCRDCHAAMDDGFAAEHDSLYGSGCRTCHDGSGFLTDLNHGLLFPLQGQHATLLCRDCHVGGTPNDLAAECVACHVEPEIHLGQFGTNCTYCHTAEGWSPARLQYHTFPLDHSSVAEVACELCHPSTYADYTCTNCHEHTPAQMDRIHRVKGISPIQDCAACHPVGEPQDERTIQG